MAKMVLLDPAIAPTPVKGKLAPRPETLNGKTVGFLWNHRHGGDRVLNLVEQRLSQKYQLKGTLRKTKSYHAAIAPKEMREELSSKCDVVITALGD